MKRKVKYSPEATRVLNALGIWFITKKDFIYFEATKSELSCLHDLISEELTPANRSR